MMPTVTDGIFLFFFIIFPLTVSGWLMQLATTQTKTETTFAGQQVISPEYLYQGGENALSLDPNSCITINYENLSADAKINHFNFARDIPDWDFTISHAANLVDAIRGVFFYEGSSCETLTIKVAYRIPDEYQPPSTLFLAGGPIEPPYKLGSWRPVWLSGQGGYSTVLKKIKVGSYETFSNSEEVLAEILKTIQASDHPHNQRPHNTSPHRINIDEEIAHPDYLVDSAQSYRQNSYPLVNDEPEPWLEGVDTNLALPSGVEGGNDLDLGYSDGNFMFPPYGYDVDFSKFIRSRTPSQDAALGIPSELVPIGKNVERSGHMVEEVPETVEEDELEEGYTENNLRLQLEGDYILEQMQIQEALQSDKELKGTKDANTLKKTKEFTTAEDNRLAEVAEEDPRIIEEDLPSAINPQREGGDLVPDISQTRLQQSGPEEFAEEEVQGQKKLQMEMPPPTRPTNRGQVSDSTPLIPNWENQALLNNRLTFAKAVQDLDKKYLPSVFRILVNANNMIHKTILELTSDRDLTHTDAYLLKIESLSQQRINFLITNERLFLEHLQDAVQKMSENDARILTKGADSEEIRAQEKPSEGGQR
ncbi:hypothetical protein H072_9269 [Dactylellina haptotyla CBS 200.50]|uniref:Uncharacterized protein n=1 Tax=Dactylellina haptotyla (strain CBS 200.50) TaxID=1284197 RepID=S8A279_DACHA|nr:hypothetical protein H072_9269 [Dactylellina haptotyla CBS 200.50]